MYDPVFLDALAHTLEFEGGYVNNPKDPGGETNKGITVATARANNYMGPMASIPDSVVQSIYFDAYWEKPGLSKLSPFMPELAKYLFDIGVNQGPATAIKYLQTGLNYLAHTPVTVDGKLGPKTIDAIWNLNPARRETLRRLVGMQHGARYLEICYAKPEQRMFLAGWAKRVKV